MGSKTAIEWTDFTQNFWVGCKKVSPGCKNCYMFRDMLRYGKYSNDIRRTAKATFNAPLKWVKDQTNWGKFVFTCSWSDFFIEEADEWRDEAWDIIRQTPQLCYQILTKRPENISDRLPKDWGNGWNNVWLGTSVESDKYMERIEQLSDVESSIRFVSYEPALGNLDWKHPTWVWIDWLIAGGESDKSPRLPNLEWFREAQNMCSWHGIKFFAKQLGGTPQNKHGGTEPLYLGFTQQTPEFNYEQE